MFFSGKGKTIRLDLEEKKRRLTKELGRFETLMVAFSGGVDSTLLLASARRILGRKVLAVTSASPVHPQRETDAAIEIAKALDVSHLVIRTEEMRLPEFTINSGDRCYICKKNLLNDLFRIAAEKGIAHVAHGANVDDGSDYRPGAKAAEEMGAVAPLRDAGLTKDEIRKLSKELGLSTWNKPAMACLASRIPYGEKISPEALKMVDRAEEIVLSLGFGMCRLRHHGSVARIEVMPEDLAGMLDPSTRETLVCELRRIGYLHVAVDLEGYVQGGMNRDLIPYRSAERGDRWGTIITKRPMA